MKPLKDIGQRICISTTQFSDPICCRPTCEHGTVYTDSERREFAQKLFFRAYKMGVDKMNKYEQGEASYPPVEWDCEEFLKSEGL